MIDTNLINEFWEWFGSSEKLLSQSHSAGDSATLDRLLRPQMARLKPLQPRLNWEIGPLDATKTYFAVCPTTIDNIPLAEAIVERAPRLENWGYRVGRPAKPESVRSLLSIEDCNGQLKEFNCEEWRVALKPSIRTGCVDVLLIASDLPSGIEGVKANTLAYITLDNWLGELTCLTAIGHATVIASQCVPAGIQTMHLNELSTALEHHIERSARDGATG